MTVEIASFCGIKIYAQLSNRVTFFNSPYPAHFEHKAVDIYPFFHDAPSPVEGKVTYIYEFTAPRTKQFQMLTKEYLIAIETPVASEYLVRILHVKPIVKVGDSVKVGQILGEMVKNGHFDSWTDLHMHVEIRPRDNLIRARGGMPIYASLKWEKFYGMLPASSFQGKVIVQRPNYTLLKGPIARMGLFSGLPVTVGKGIGILDGGLPHYGFGGVLARGKVEIGDPVYIDGVKIGHVTNIYSDGFARFEVEPFSVKLDNFIMKGISCYMGLSGDFMWKLIPQDGKKMSLKDKASVIICPQGQAHS